MKNSDKMDASESLGFEKQLAVPEAAPLSLGTPIWLRSKQDTPYLH